ncbi:MAG TPA: glycoside hydrolase N-terminal domain-containing protein [Lacibacter sp.]|nr:glycoside hydrolase N-terminal domain-containing protein [Lacibacter sp.]
MKQIASLFFIILLLALSLVVNAQRNDVTIRFNTPATHFTESLPLGNGRLGAMMFGDTKKERIALNEISLWSGGPQDADNENAYQFLKPIQDYLLAGDNKAAQDLLQKNFISKGKGSGHGRGANEKYGAYQTMGDLFISWKDSNAVATNYSRVLDIERAVASTTFTRNGSTFSEEIFTDFVNDITWVRLSSTKKNGINIVLSLYRKENVTYKTKKSTLAMMGQLPSGADKGMQFVTVAQPTIKDGTIKQEGNQLVIENATECWIKISSVTNYDYATGNLSSEDFFEDVFTYIEKTKQLTYTVAQQKSTAAYQQLFNRCRWTMPDSKPSTALTTNQRLINYNKGQEDLQLPVLYFNYGRYLLIGSSRPGLLPANLQGLWAVEYQTPWNGDYHLNINIQMNYWPAELTNLGALTEPMHRFTSSLVPNGTKTAKAYYNAQGWVAHVISNPWFFTSPGEGAAWGSTLTGGAWLCEHIWEHYRFTKDTVFLRKYYPVLKGAAQFLQSILIKEPTHGWLVTAPSNSPEHAYKMPNGFVGNTCMGPTMDMQISRELFNACITASTILNTDQQWRNELEKTVKQLAPNQIGAKGDLNEWVNDWEDAEPHHRHVSHLYGLHPYDEISIRKTPALAEAVKQTLLQRGDAGTGWSMAWKLNFWARLHDGEHALQLFKQLVKPVAGEDGIKMSGGGTYPNLFCAHPPFQIDGNFGATAGLAEMLLQSNDEEIELLPALPAAWHTGTIKGLCARNDFDVSMEWKNGKLVSFSLLSKSGNDCTVLYQGKSLRLKTTKGKTYRFVHNDFK